MSAFREQSLPGAAFVFREAVKRGYSAGDAAWCNLGQGQPQLGPIPGAPDRPTILALEESDCAYGPVGGTREMRQAVADHYNRLYRSGLRSQYSADNVAIAAGGRLALSRVLHALGTVRLGFQTPDYMSFDELIAHNLNRLVLVEVPTSQQNGFRPAADELLRVIEAAALDALIFSNPCNPTGQLLEGEALRRLVSGAYTSNCTLIIDEFYSHYIYAADGSLADSPVSAARYVGDVDRDPVVIVDGLTKNFRRPGWRLGWIVGPAETIEKTILSGTAIDGGPSMLVQRAALDVLAPAPADEETRAIRAVFAHKRNLLLDGLRKVGIRVPSAPRGTFYVWGDLSALPSPLKDADAFFYAALARKVVTVPGRFFDLDPAKRRTGGRVFTNWMRFSFGPDVASVTEGLERIAGVVASFRR
jgi:aspartate/methionine/tyrosine aminotransferase